MPGTLLQKKDPQAHQGLRISFIILHFLFSYFKYIFAFLQMYIASIAATATTAIEIIVNIIIFSFLNFLNLQCYPNLFFIPLLFGVLLSFSRCKGTTFSDRLYLFYTIFKRKSH